MLIKASLQKKNWRFGETPPHFQQNSKSHYLRWWRWTFVSSKQIYYVEKNNIQCRCDLKCTLCKACIHHCSCTCIDYSIKWNISKHIHQVFVCLLTRSKLSWQLQIPPTLLLPILRRQQQLIRIFMKPTPLKLCSLKQLQIFYYKRPGKKSNWWRIDSYVQ